MSSEQDKTAWNWEPIPQYGVFRRGDAAKENYVPNVLVVLIHGILGTCDKTWGDLPKFLLKSAGFECDVFSYQYAAGVGQRASMLPAAMELWPALAGYLKRYDHFVFVVHSTGGLILKYLLVDDFRRISELEEISSRENPNVEERLITRVRAIVNVTVPHYGGTRALSRTVIPLAHGVSKLLEVPLGLAQLVLSRTPALGHNNIAWELRWGNLELQRLDDDFNKCLAAVRRWGLAFPVPSEIRASDDQAVPEDAAFDSSKRFCQYPKPTRDHLQPATRNAVRR